MVGEPSLCRSGYHTLSRALTWRGSVFVTCDDARIWLSRCCVDRNFLYVHIYIYISVYFFLDSLLFLFFFFLFIYLFFRIIFGWLIFEQDQISHLDSPGTRSQFTTFIRETDRWEKKESGEPVSLPRLVATVLGYILRDHFYKRY